MYKAIVTLHTPEIADYAELTASNKEKYAERWGVNFMCFRSKFNELHPAWSKLIAIQKALETNDLVLWIDADAFIRDMNYDLFADIEKNKKPFLTSTDTDYTMINSGVIAVRNTKRVKKYLSLFNSIGLKGYPPEWNLKGVNMNWWEQSAIIAAHKNSREFYNMVGFLDEKVFNSYKRDSGAIYHLAGISHEERVNIIKSML